MLDLEKKALTASLSARIQELWDVEHDPVVEVPPRRELGDLAFPAPLHLARVLRRAPRVIAEELASAWELPKSAARVEVAGAGYLNVFLHRSRFARRALEESFFSPEESTAGSKVIVEHTNINPNKAAHIGHLRNAVLGDVLVRLLRGLGHPVEVQNYIDDTGVQLADVVVGFLDIRGLSTAEVEALPEPFDYLCWDLYAEVGNWYGDDASRLELRRTTLHSLEEGQGERARMGNLVAKRIVHRHLETMGRLEVEYDLLTHESDILHGHFFTEAFELLKEKEAIRLEGSGKNEGCWVMPLSEVEEFAGLEDPDKVIVRSDGTVTYVGKDIAYQLWKLGLLDKDFAYRRWQEEDIWITTQEGEQEHPDFGAAAKVINVIDARQSYLQKIVRAGVEALGYQAEADRSIHFAYEMVSLSRQTARQLGFLDEASEGGGSLEMSGRKGIGVKADDLLDQLEAKSRELAARNGELPDEEKELLGRQIANAALRYLMTKTSTSRVIAFDLEEALSFEGESGPYLQYSMVRAANIGRKLDAAGLASTVTADEVEQIDAELWDDDLWDLVLAAGQIAEVTERAAESLELSLVARHTFELARRFHGIYNRHPILHEENEQKRLVRLATTRIFTRALGALCDLLGIPIPDRM